MSRWKLIKTTFLGLCFGVIYKRNPQIDSKAWGFFLLKGFTDTDQLLCYLLKEESAVISSLKIMFHISATKIYPGSWDGTTGSCPVLECQLQVSVCCMK